MWDNFFTYKTQIPAGIGWEHYSPIHLTYLIGFLVLTIVLVIIYRRATTITRHRIQIAYAVIVLTLELVKDGICLITGVWEPGLFPFHLCGMTIIFIVIHTIKANKWTAELLYALSLPGAICALLFSDWTVYPLANFFCQQSFFIHFFEASFPILLLASGEIRPRVTNLWRCLVFLAIVIPPIYFFNLTFDTNFFFLNTAAPGSPLAPLQTLGMPGYFFGFAGLVLVFWLVMYTPWMIKSWIERRRRRKFIFSKSA